MSQIVVSDAAVLLKRQYPKRGPAWTAREKSAFLAEVSMPEDFEGLDATINVSIAGPTGVSANFTKARANVGSTGERQFVLTRRKLYAIQQIENEVIAASQSDAGALEQLIKYHTNRAVGGFNEAFADTIWSIGGGALTKLTAAGTTLTNAYFTCDPITDAARFNIGMKITFASDDGTAVTPAGMRGSPAGETLTVTAVDEATGKVTVSGVLNTIDSIAATDYVHRDGDYGVAITGVRGWIPSTAPTSELFFNVDRTAHLTRLSGHRYTGTGTYLHTMRTGFARMRHFGAKPDRLYTNPLDWAVIEGEIGSKAMVELPKAEVELGHSGLRYMSPAGTVLIVSEPQVPQGEAWALKLDTWAFRSAGGCPRYLTQPLGRGKGENLLFTVESFDGGEMRMGTYGNLFCYDPGQNGVFKWPTA